MKSLSGQPGPLKGIGRLLLGAIIALLWACGAAFAQGYCPQCKQSYSSKACPIHGIRLTPAKPEGKKLTRKPVAAKPPPAKSALAAGKSTSPVKKPIVPTAAHTPTGGGDLPKTALTGIPAKPPTPPAPKPAFDATATNTIKSSLRAARQERTTEIGQKVETNITIALAQNGDPNVRDEYPDDPESSGDTALLWALRERPGALVALLFSRGADLKVKNNRGDTALHAAANTDADTVRMLVEKGVDYNAVNKEGKTALILAVDTGNKDVVVTLLSIADINSGAADTDGWTALHFAVQRGNADMVKLLLQKKVEINARSKKGDTALKLARARGNSEIEEMLIVAGAKDSDG